MIKLLNKRTLVLGIAVALAGSSIGSLHAQQFGGGEAAQDSSEVVSNMQAQAQALPVASSRTDSARQMAMDFVNGAVDAGSLDVGSGWNPGREVFVAIGVANYPVSNPAADPNFGQARALKSLEASLIAKRSIIEFVRLELDFSSVVSLPETGLGTEFDLMRADLEQEIAVAMFAYQNALKEAGAAEASNLQGVTMGELVKEGIAGFIQSRWNPELDVARMEADKRQRFEEAQNNLKGLQGRLDQLTSQAEQLRGQVQQTQGFDVETFASMTVVGSLMVGQFESWMDGNYEISVVYMWSPQQEQQIRNVLAGQTQQGRPGRQSLGQYIRSTDWSTAIGGRKFRDDTGSMHVVGVGAWPMRGNSSAQRRAAEGFALRMAQSQVALAFSGDVVARDRAQAKMDEIAAGGVDGETTTAFAESFSSELSQSTQMTLQGVQTRYSNVVRHPISGQEMHVVVVTASAAQTAAAKQMEETLFRAAGAVAGLQQFSRGTRAGLEDRLERERSDTRQFQQGRSAGNAPSSAQTAPARATQQSVPAVSTPSSITGGGTDLDSFDW